MQRQRCRWRDDEALEADLEETLSLDSNSTTVDVHATLRLRLWLGRFDIAGGVFEGTVDAIRDAGYPLISEKESDGRTLYRFLTGFKKIPPITFSLEELMTLYLCRGQLSFLQGSPFQDDLEAIFGRLRSSLPPRSVAHLERIASAATPRFQGIRDYQGKKQLLGDLRKALLYQYRCRLTYTPPHREAAEYEFDPYTLLFFNNSLYLGGYAHNRNALRLFLVDRVDQVELLEDRFEVPEEYNADDLTGNAFGLIEGETFEMKVRFCSAVAHLVRERHWHSSQSIDEQEDGSLILSLQVSGEKEILSWLYSYLPHVQVLEPPHLMQLFTNGLRESLANIST